MSKADWGFSTPVSPIRAAVGARLAHHDVIAPDIETSSDDYASRFAGPVGEWMLQTQTREVLSLLCGPDGRCPSTVLELGGGHGQLAGSLAGAGMAVEVHGSAPVCFDRVAPLLARMPGRIGVTLGRLDALTMPDHSRDAVIAVRLMAHYHDWRGLLAEMTRIARHTVLIDFTPNDGFQRLSLATFGLKRRIEGNTRPFFTHAVDEVTDELARHGFTQIRLVRLFALPMVLHRRMKRPGLSRWLEWGADVTGLRSLVGGPVLLCARRREW